VPVAGGLLDDKGELLPELEWLLGLATAAVPVMPEISLPRLLRLNCI